MEIWGYFNGGARSAVVPVTGLAETRHVGPPGDADVVWIHSTILGQVSFWLWAWRKAWSVTTVV